MSSVRYTADDVREQLFAPPFHKELAKQQAEKYKFSVNTTSRNLCRVRLSVGELGVLVSYAMSYDFVCWSATHIESLCLLWRLFQVDMCKKLMQVATEHLETRINLMHGIEACSEVLESVGLGIDDNMKHDCLCTRAGLYLKVCLLLCSSFQSSFAH